MQITSVAIVVPPSKEWGFPLHEPQLLSPIISWDFLRENIRITAIAKPNKPKIFKSPQNISSSVPDFMAFHRYKQIPYHRNNAANFLRPFTAPLYHFTTLNKTS